MSKVLPYYENNSNCKRIDFYVYGTISEIHVAKLLSFTISNFRGARKVTIDLANKHNAPVVTLIGLNESGKTTILDAISYFAGYDTALDEVLDHKEARSALHSFIPLSEEAAFTGDVEIEAEIEITKDDKEKLAAVVLSKGGTLLREKVPNKCSISVKYSFVKSKFVESEYAAYWSGASFEFVPKGKRKSIKVSGAADENKPVWTAMVQSLKASLPQIVYFPTFLVDMPARIYLEKIGTEEDNKNDYYFKILQNIAQSGEKKLDLHELVVERIRTFQSEDGTASWSQNLTRSVAVRPINAVFSQMSGTVSRQILPAWKDVLGKSLNIERITFDWNTDPEFDHAPYVTIQIHDRESSYDLKQRSLGFRWFFSFLLFTVFGGAKDKKKLFLFDEPAANLHVRAQRELLKSFKYLADRGDIIIYSTHSAHMIDEHMLSGAYIVENKAVDLDEDELGDYVPRPTDIKALPYRQFVSTYPARTNYFQPVLERLQHLSSPLGLERPVLIVEGPSDFYALTYVRSRKMPNVTWDIIPSESAGKCGPLIGLCLGKGIKFSVLLDDDGAGRKERDRYIENWSLSASQVRTLGDLDPTYKDRKIEGMLDEASLDLVRAKFEGKSNKKILSLYLAEASAKLEDGWLSESSESSILNVLQLVDLDLT